MKVVNYTGLKKREKYIYTILGAEIPGGGVSVKFLATVGACELLFNVVGVIVSVKTHTPYVDLSTGKSFYGMFFIIAPAVIGFLINKTKIKGHDLHVYIFYAIKYAFSKKYKDIDGNSCNDAEVRNRLWVDENQ